MGREDGLVLRSAGVGAIVAAVFARAVGCDFFQIDDFAHVLDHPQISLGLSFERMLWATVNPVLGNWTPVAWFSHMLDMSLFGAWAPGHHATSVLLHALTAAFLYAFLERNTEQRLLSAIAVLFFALHPLRVESVVWIAERRDVLAGLFATATLLAYSAFVRTRSVPAYAGALVLFGLGLGSKATLVTFPFALLLVDVWPLGRFRNRAESLRSFDCRFPALLEKIPFIARAIGASLLTIVAQSDGGAIVPTSVLPVADRAANAAASIAHYLGKTLWPSDLSVMVMHPSLFGGTGHAGPTVALSLFVILALSALAWVFRQRGYPLVGWLWFVGMLVPTLGFVQAGLQALAYRYTYLPHMGLCIGLVWTFSELAKRIPGVDIRRFALVAGLALVFLTGATVVEIGYWKSTESVFKRSIVTRHGAWNHYFNLGRAYLVDERYDEALPALMEAGARLPKQGGAELVQALASIYESIGKSFEGLGDTERAAQAYRRSLAAHPSAAVAADLDRLAGVQERGEP
ncbi:MAG: tetratricopeptide repeat protein [Myxococcota bacterium]|nr:tetratricopeptide repeat protein [Myxococcota bacterium]